MPIWLMIAIKAARIVLRGLLAPDSRMTSGRLSPEDLAYSATLSLATVGAVDQAGIADAIASLLAAAGLPVPREVVVAAVGAAMLGYQLLRRYLVGPVVPPAPRPPLGSGGDLP